MAMTGRVWVWKTIYRGWQAALLLLTTNCGGNAVLPANSVVIEKLTTAEQVHAIHFVAPSLGYVDPQTATPILWQSPEYPDFIHKIGLENPSENVKSSFLTLWKGRFPSLTISNNPEPFPYRDLHDLKTRYSPNLLFEFYTDRWQFGGSFTERPFLHLQFEAHTWLTDSVTGKILWRGHCFTSKDLADEHSGKRLTLEDLKALDWKPLKSAWKDAANTCAHDMVSQFSS